jgi:prepilin-type N-terminal cleavage/methylation domain-containing protein/prepilin-type processing-associated H-X9-DG protein
MRQLKKPGFTLVELLVVIGIIAVLISILLPALNKARMSAQLVSCQANQKQILQGILMYANDNHGYFPTDLLSTLLDPRVGSMQPYQWYTKPFVGQYLGVKTETATYTTSRIFFCPAMPVQKSTLGGIYYGNDFGIGYNCNANARLWKPDQVGKVNAKLGTIQRSSSVIMTGDTGQSVLVSGNVNANAYRLVQMYNATPADPPKEAVSYRHGLKANIGFADGHVDSFLAKTPDNFVLGTHQTEGVQKAIDAGQITYIARTD